MPPLQAPDPPLDDGVIVIRELRESDADAVIAACQDPEIPRWTPIPADYSRADWDERWAKAEQAALAGTGLHLTITAADGELVGSIGLVVVDQQRSYAEIGYWIAKEVRGRGYSTRAIRLLSDWATAILGLRSLEILVDPLNTASRRVAVAAGLRRGRQRARVRSAAVPGDVVVHVISVP